MGAAGGPRLCAALRGRRLVGLRRARASVAGRFCASDQYVDDIVDASGAGCPAFAAERVARAPGGVGGGIASCPPLRPRPHRERRHRCRTSVASSPGSAVKYAWKEREREKWRLHRWGHVLSVSGGDLVREFTRGPSS
eukprot:ctg_824.g276